MSTLFDFTNCNGVDESISDPVKVFGPNLKVLPPNDQIRELQTIIRDRYDITKANRILILYCSVCENLV